MAIIFNYFKLKSYKSTKPMELADLVHNEKFLLSQIQELEEEIILLMQNILTKNTILQHDKYSEQINIYKKQLLETKKQIKQWKI